MPKNILLINSLKDCGDFMADLLKFLDKKDCRFHLFAVSGALFDKFSQNNWPRAKKYFGPALESKCGVIMFFLILPFLYLFYGLSAAACARAKKISVFVCLNINEKIIFSPVAKILKLKLVWIEYPGAARYDFFLLKRLYKLFSNWAQIAVFDDLTKEKLALAGVSEEKINLILLGVKVNQLQNTIFTELAQAKINRRKYFTIGTVVGLNCRHNIKSLFGAIKICSTVVPEIQLIIVGDEEKRKDLIWLAKKLEIDSLIWFVGQQNNLRKWLNNFHLFFISTDNAGVNDFEICLQTMAAGLPVIGFKDFGLEYFIKRNGLQSGVLAERNDSEGLAQQIIKLRQNERLRLEFAANAKEIVGKYFTMEKMAEEFGRLI